MECMEWSVSPLPQLVTVGYGVWKPGMRHFSRNFGLYDVLFVRTGCIYMAEDEKEYEVRAGHMLALEPGKTHVGYRDSTEETELYWIHIKHDSAQSRISAEHIPWSLVLRKGNDSDLAPANRPIYMPKYGYLELGEAWGILEEMVQLHNRLSVETVLKLQARFVQLLAKLQELVRTSEADSRSGRLAGAVAAYLRRHESLPFHTGQLENEFHYHVDYVSRCLKRHTGMSPLEYLRHVRMEKARRLLEQSAELTVKQIAEMVCMADANYFSRMFRKETGMSPAAYRKKRLGYS
ncbi:helix-turn-helix domain-containing protein [Paenibacillus hemerocallicola]|uniref:Helix-turn-helix domain-containing protein n=1 Tax=Paenibacillus hemerocallicola TaxID=1172614 RepID=A0A5C4TAW5_9BACL|nr:AraC family transcriptional regulator [Paenibacillus hemerocallicola]TNJ65597.1 helix-turn-helix domain-containing protein [Paenibacillus hemerocallicola]